MKEKFNCKYSIEYRNTDNNLIVTLPQFMGFIQETSIRHGNYAGNSIEWYNENNCGFILINWDIKIKRYPKYNEEFFVYTWPISFKGFLADRIFVAKDINDNEILTAYSKWIYLDLKTLKPIKVTKELMNNYNYFDDGTVYNSDYKIENIDELNLIKSIEYVTKRKDLDSNNHVNNIKYIEWAIDTLDNEVYYRKKIVNLKVAYKKECKLDEIIKIKLFYKNDNKYFVFICNDETLFAKVLIVLE